MARTELRRPSRVPVVGERWNRNTTDGGFAIVTGIKMLDGGQRLVHYDFTKCGDTFAHYRRLENFLEFYAPAPEQAKELSREPAEICSRHVEARRVIARELPVIRSGWGLSLAARPWDRRGGR